MNRINLVKNCLLLTYFICIFSCKKSDQISNHLTGSYVTDSFLTVSAPAMYTKNSVITDSNTIKAYVSRLSNWYPNPFPCTSCSFSFGTTQEAATSSIHINFVSSTQGIIQHDSYAKENCLIRIQNNNAVFVSKDTVPFGSGNNGNPCSKVVNKTYIYKAPYDTCLPLSTSSGGSYFCQSQPVELVVALSGDLYLPEIQAFTGKTGTSVGSCYSPAQFLNVFNSDLQKFLAPSDTVVVQLKSWKLKKM